MKLCRIAESASFSVMLAACATVVPADVARTDGSYWMDPAAKTASQLLYVSDQATFDVYVYRFPSLKLAGKLHGFKGPQGECADASGNVWIADTQASRVVEYAHGGEKAIARLADPIGYPAGCAVDPSSGDLAVTNLYDFSGSGSLLVYKSAHGTPKVYANSNVYYYYFDAYDRGGNLYVSGATANGGYVLAVLPYGSKSIATVKIDGGKLHFPGTVAWLGATLVLGDQRCKGRMVSCFYELSVSGRSAGITGTTPLRGSCDVVQAWVDTTRIAGGDDAEYCRGGRSAVEVWPYPVGGSPGSSVRGPRIPIGAAMSVRRGP
jgi:hypothetical protein